MVTSNFVKSQPSFIDYHHNSSATLFKDYPTSINLKPVVYYVQPATASSSYVATFDIAITDSSQIASIAIATAIALPCISKHAV